MNIDGKECEAIIIDKVYSRRRKRKLKGKEYEWKECCVWVYIPSTFEGKKLALVPLPQ